MLARPEFFGGRFENLGGGRSQFWREEVKNFWREVNDFLENDFAKMNFVNCDFDENGL